MQTISRWKMQRLIAIADALEACRYHDLEIGAATIDQEKRLHVTFGGSQYAVSVTIEEAGEE